GIEGRRTPGFLEVAPGLERRGLEFRLVADDGLLDPAAQLRRQLQVLPAPVIHGLALEIATVGDQPGGGIRVDHAPSSFRASAGESAAPFWKSSWQTRRLATGKASWPEPRRIRAA